MFLSIAVYFFEILFGINRPGVFSRLLHLFHVLSFTSFALGTFPFTISQFEIRIHLVQHFERFVSLAEMLQRVFRPAVNPVIALGFLMTLQILFQLELSPGMRCITFFVVIQQKSVQKKQSSRGCHPGEPIRTPCPAVSFYGLRRSPCRSD